MIVREFGAIDQLPVELRFQGNLNVDDLVNNSDLWHKSCHLKFNNDKLARARKQKKSNPDDGEQC